MGLILAWPLTTLALVLDPASGMRDPLKLAGHLAVRCVADDGESIEEVAQAVHAAEFTPRLAKSKILFQHVGNLILWKSTQ